MAAANGTRPDHVVPFIADCEKPREFCHDRARRSSFGKNWPTCPAVYGARPIKRTIQRELESPLSKRLLAGEVADGARVRVDAQDGEFVWSNPKSGAKKP
ncbi:MAG: hypothetical protein HZA91_17790 [Verrucomicrobia bacterium]|nr:hypothetical protein [Verrucomicrobiota bacterium]